MKLYMHPVSTTSRTVLLFIAEAKLDVELKVVDLLTGEHHKEPFISINPNRLVPVLEDGDMILTECSAILKYLAEKSGSPAYPRDLRQRAKVNEMMDWFNANIYRDYGYGLLYPQIFPNHQRPDDTVHKGTIQWGLEKSKSWLEILDKYLLGTHRAYLCGDAVTIADYMGAVILEAGKAVGCKFSAYPNVERWMQRMRKLPSWNKVHEVFYGFADSLKGARFVSI